MKIDPIHFDLLMTHPWRQLPRGYVSYNHRCRKGPRRPMLFHRIVTNAPEGMYVDHMNGDTSDNRMENLRVVTMSENMQNRRKVPANNTSGCIGVVKSRGKWVAQAMHNKKTVYIGIFSTYEEACNASIAWRRNNLPGFISAPGMEAAS